MIQWKTAGEGLSRAVAALGVHLYVQDGDWYINNEPATTSKHTAAVQAVIDAYPLQAWIDERCAEVEAYAAKLLDAQAKGKSAVQLAYEPLKKIEADALSKGGTAPLLEAEALARGITVEELATKVLTKSDQQAQIVGVAGKHKDAIRGLTTFEDVAAYDFSEGWP